MFAFAPQGKDVNLYVTNLKENCVTDKIENWTDRE